MQVRLPLLMSTAALRLAYSDDLEVSDEDPYYRGLSDMTPDQLRRRLREIEAQVRDRLQEREVLRGQVSVNV